MRRNVQTGSNKTSDRTFERSAIETTSLSRRAVETSLIKNCSLSSVSVLCSRLIQSNETHSVVNIDESFSSSFLLVFNCNENGIERSGDYIALKIYDSPFTVRIERTIAVASRRWRKCDANQSLQQLLGLLEPGLMSSLTYYSIRLRNAETGEWKRKNGWWLAGSNGSLPFVTLSAGGPNQMEGQTGALRCIN